MKQARREVATHRDGPQAVGMPLNSSIYRIDRRESTNGHFEGQFLNVTAFAWIESNHDIKRADILKERFSAFRNTPNKGIAMKIEIILDGKTTTVTKQRLLELLSQGQVGLDMPINVDGKLATARTIFDSKANATPATSLAPASSLDFVDIRRKCQSVGGILLVIGCVLFAIAYNLASHNQELIDDYNYAMNNLSRNGRDFSTSVGESGRAFNRLSNSSYPPMTINVLYFLSALSVVCGTCLLVVSWVMRPQDVCNMRLCDIDMSGGEVWEYAPWEHKTEHVGKGKKKGKKNKIIRWLGPKAQEILASYVAAKATTPEAFLFSPIDAVKYLDAEKRMNRQSKVQPSQMDRSKPNPMIKPGDKYTTGSYRTAIKRACKRGEIEEWSPNQLRHTWATYVEKKYGPEAARIILGHTNVDTTLIYIERDNAKGREIAREIG